MNNNPSDLVSFDDLPLAAFLHLQGHRLVTIKPHKERPKLASFYFPLDEKINHDVAVFFSKRATIEPKAYLDKIRTLKGLCNDVLGSS